jgi:CheY-like chemotaxis protein
MKQSSHLQKYKALKQMLLQQKQERLSPLEEVVNILHRLCKGSRTGILYMLTHKGHGATTTLLKGRIIDIAYLKSHGIEALLKLRKVPEVKFVFKQNMGISDNPGNRSYYLPSTNMILNKLGMDITEVAPWLGEEVKKLLVVDDSPLSRKVIINIFNRESYDITEAEDGLDALNKMKETTFDLVLLDLVLPKIDGYEVLETMKKSNSQKDIPVIMLTSRDTLMDKLKGKMSATDEYLTKPVNAEKLMGIVRKYLR